jgi:DNA repair protein NreA
MASLCQYCKGPHHYTTCALYLRAIKQTAKTHVGKDFSGESPAPFVGHYGYPHLNVGLLSIPDTSNTASYDNPQVWAAQNKSIDHVASLRRSMINATQNQSIKKRNRHLNHVQEVAMATKPPELEVNLKKAPSPRLVIDQAAAPHGSRAQLLKSAITSNTKIHTKVDRVFSDTDRKAADALTYLHKSGFDENQLTKILSVGTVGVQSARKLVPTRWSITATDDILGKKLLKEIKDNKILEPRIYEGDFMGNYYYIVCFSRAFSYELFELYGPKFKQGIEQYSTDYESFFGRKKYAEQCAGGYYSVRLALLEHFQKIKRQASTLVLRVITEEYTTPLGVWVTREATRKALASQPITHIEESMLIPFVLQRIKRKFGIDLTNLIKRSKTIQERKQRTLSQWN